MMRRTKLFLIVYRICFCGSGLVLASPTKHPSQAAASACPELPPLWRGALCLVAGRYEQTIGICNELLRSDPDKQRAYAVRGYAHLLKRDNPRQAIADFTEVLRHDPGNATMYVARGRAFEQSKEYDRAIADFNQAIRLDPRNSDAYAFRAECYAWVKASVKATVDYTAALRIDPDLTWVRARRGMLYFFHRREWARALTDFDEVLRSVPDDREVKHARCFVHLIYRDFHRAVAESSDLIRLDPREARWYWLRSLVYLAKGEYIPSFSDTVVAVMLNPGAIKIRFIGPRSLFMFIGPPSIPSLSCEVDNNLEKRIADCTKRIHRDPNNVAAHYERAYAYMTKREYKQAAADFDEIIRLDPLDAEAYRTRGNLLIDLGACTDALKDFAEAMRLDPSYAENYTRRARAYATMGKHEEALRDCTEALRLDPRFVLTYTLRGSVHQIRKEYDLAIADYSEAIRLSPIDPDLYERRAEVRDCAGDLVGAIADCKEVIKINPANTRACAKLARYLCSSPDASLRDGKEARRLAKLACEATSWRDWESLISMGIACAECGDFDAALRWERESEKIAPERAKSYIQWHLERFLEHKPPHPTSPQKTSTSPSSK